MRETAQHRLLPAREVARQVSLLFAGNGLRYGTWGATEVQPDTLAHIVGAVPPAVAEALARRAYYFVPLAIGETDDVEVAPDYTAELGDRAICHRNLEAWGRPSTFISARLMRDRFALAFEFFINVGHQAVDAIPVPAPFIELVLKQAAADVRGETSQDSWEARRRINEGERAKVEYTQSTLSDALAIYMLSLTLDLDYADLREREYPLLAPAALAERLRLVAELFPPAESYEFAIRYRRRP
jgi:hypothetical protein